MGLRQAILDSEPQTNNDRWSQLRAQKVTAQPTTWDTIRQAHERKAGDPGTAQSDVNNTENDAEKQRRKAQAEFDALLEKERSFGQDNTRELKSRWS